MARPEKKPTDQERGQVQTLSGYGLNQEQIANMLGMSRQTLAKWCKAELEKGKTIAYTQVVSKLFDNIKKGKEASIFFYLKTQHGWRESITISGDPDAPFKVLHYVDAPRESRNEWEQRQLHQAQKPIKSLEQ